jgi:hypothetical protein
MDTIAARAEEIAHDVVAPPDDDVSPATVAFVMRRVGLSSMQTGAKWTEPALIRFLTVFVKAADCTPRDARAGGLR